MSEVIPASIEPPTETIMDSNPTSSVTEDSVTLAEEEEEPEVTDETFENEEQNAVEGSAVEPVVVVGEDTTLVNPIISDYDVPIAVSAERKKRLLLEARTNRLGWIRSVPLPYLKETTSLLDATHICKELPSATKILTHLYGEVEAASKMKELMTKDGDALRTSAEVLEDEFAEAEGEVQEILKSYQYFLRYLERPESSLVVNGMRNSLKKLGNDPAASLRTLVASTMEQFNRQSDQQQEGTKRSLESFLYGHAHDAIWSTLTKEQEEDFEFNKKLQQLSFVTAKHLDLKCFETDVDHLNGAVSILSSMQRYYSPYEKLQRILKVYHAINEALKKAQGGKLPSADDVLPALILTVLQAKPRKLVANLRMLEIYGPAEYLRGEAGYAYTNLYGAVQFLLDIDLNEEGPITSLTITPQEFREGLEACRSATQVKLENCIKKNTQVDEESITLSIEIPVAEVRAARLRGETVDLEWARQHFVPSNATSGGEDTAEVDDILPTGFTRNYSFLSTRPEEIRMSDLPQLLQEYRMLVRTTETLIADRSQRASRERKDRLIKMEKAIQESALEADIGLVGQPKKPSMF